MAVQTQEQLLTHLKLPDLPYDYDALEPVISREIMELHHGKHHQAYVNNFNSALDATRAAAAKQDLEAVIALQPQLRFNGGGHLNHTIFWTNLAPKSKGGGQPPNGQLKQAIETQWGSLDHFIERFNGMTAAIQGSGWGWLGYDRENKRLVLATTPNQDPLLGYAPLLGVDVWEHAYYLVYKNARPAYLKAIWEVVNWADVAKRYNAARSA
jgi:superoxide dismutase, Fe-Mn family